jgi:transcriptional regulator with XRE-family HTH domain
VNKALPSAALGQVIRRLRRERNLSLEKLARRSKIAIGTLWRTELTRIDPHWSTVEKIARGLGVSMGEIGLEVVKQETLGREDAEQRQT